MSLVFAAITPHPPLLIPSIGKDAALKIQKTQKAFEKLEEDLYLSKPDIILVISPHGHHFADAFSINYAPKFETDLREFGDLVTKLKFSGEMMLPYSIREETYENNNCRTVIINEPLLDHGVVVPLYFLTQHLPEVKIMPVGFSELDYKTHLDFGSILREIILRTNKRVAVIASGDLSHALETDSPAGFHKNGAAFDAKIQELFSSHNTAGLLTLSPDFVQSAAECGFRSFLILAGILKESNYRYESYCYEAPFGVGYLTANFVI